MSAGAAPWRRGAGWLMHRALRAAAIAVPIGLALFLLFQALAYASLGTDRAALSRQVQAAFADRQLQVEDAALFGNTDIGVHQFNDCLILFQAIDDRAPRLQRAVSPLSPPPELGFPCLRLRTLTSTGADAPPHFYHQYLHAHTSLARVLVPTLGVRATRDLYRLLITFVLVVGIAYGAIDLARGRRGDANAAWLVLFLVFARGFGLEGFGQSLGHGPADLILLLYLLFLSRASATGPLSHRAAVTSAAVFGALTMAFEFLTGGLPLGLAMVIGALPLALAPTPGGARTMVEAALAFIVAAATCAVAKALLVLAVFGPAPLSEMTHQLLVRVGVAQAPARDGAAGIGDFAWNMWAALDALAPSMHWLVVGALVLAACGGVWGYRRLRRGAAEVRFIGIALAASNLAILLWMALMWQHTATHAWFMVRILTWSIASGAALFVLALRHQPAERTP